MLCKNRNMAAQAEGGCCSNSLQVNLLLCLFNMYKGCSCFWNPQCGRSLLRSSKFCSRGVELKGKRFAVGMCRYSSWSCGAELKWRKQLSFNEAFAAFWLDQCVFYLWSAVTLLLFIVQIVQDELFIQSEDYWWGYIYCPAALVLVRGETFLG